MTNPISISIPDLGTLVGDLDGGTTSISVDVEGASMSGYGGLDANVGVEGYVGAPGGVPEVGIVAEGEVSGYGGGEVSGYQQDVDATYTGDSADVTAVTDEYGASGYGGFDVGGGVAAAADPSGVGFEAGAGVDTYGGFDAGYDHEEVEISHDAYADGAY